MRLNSAFATLFAILVAGCGASVDQRASNMTAVSQAQAADAPILVAYGRTDFAIPANPADELVADFTYR